VVPEVSDDSALALALRLDPGRALPKLYERYSGLVNRLVWRLLGADPDHDDLVQQVFCKVLLAGQSLREVERLGGWVQSITINTVYEELRRRDVRRLFLRDASKQEFHPDLVRDVEARDLLLRAKAVLDRMPARERVVFVLHFMEMHSLAEVAELCGYSHATAKRRLASAIRRFQVLAGKNQDLLTMLKHRERAEP